MENTKRYWKGIEELTNSESFVKNAHREFPDAPSANGNGSTTLVDGTGTYRRDFLKTLGFSIAAVSLAACEAPVKKAIPYLNKPEDVEPTIANWYASTYTDGGDYASILVKTREGRPIKIEGNRGSSISKGGLSARAHASLLSLYDNEKLKGPKKGTTNTDWATADKEIIAGLTKIAAAGGQIRIVSNTILSPTTKNVIAEFSAKYNAKHIVYDANSASGLVEANGGVLPAYDFSKAKVIVGIGCDFLGTWISPTEFARQYAATRKVSSGKEGKKEMSRHYQFETIMSLTGANADYRGTYKPSEEGNVVASLYNEVAKKLGTATLPVKAAKVEHLEKAAADLVAAKGAALVVSGSNDTNVQQIINGINGLLNSYGTTISLGSPVNYRQGSDAAMNDFITEAKAGRIAGVIFYNANPVYDHPQGAALGEAIKKMSLSISTNDRADETGELCQYNTPDSHYLESWNDAEPKRGFYSLCQPTITTIFKTRQAQSSLLTWAGANGDYQAYLERNWKSNILGSGNWTKVLHDGVFEPGAANASINAPKMDLAAAASKIGNVKGAELELVIYEKVGMGTGSQANNPWLQEFPEPVSKATWDNYASLSQATAKKLNLKQGDVVNVEAGGKTVTLPVLVQPGQANDTVAIAIGYGRTKAGKSANGVGVNVYPMKGEIAVKLTATGEERELAQTQTHETVMGRTAVVQETVLSKYKEKDTAGREFPEIETATGKVNPNEISLWNPRTRPNHAWGMVIDLNSCTGCGACVVSCGAENNVPVVGRQEVVNRREMHWMRIDRYYSTDIDTEGMSVLDKSLEKGLEMASANPEVIMQPVMCQHCNNAPCETVCPVAATTHSTEGLNQMAYNRCIGTRYCANNCPYKVRRFNWFKYHDEGEGMGPTFDFHFNNDLGKMVINPDVTVRSRGVMEKCSMCVQRIQAGKLEAKKERRRPVDGEIEMACAQSCPTNAITFGDMNDSASAISKLLEQEKEGRAFQMLEEISVRPSVSYLVKVRNKDAKKEVEA